MAAGAVDREFLCIWSARVSFGACIAFLLFLFGEPWALFGTPWGAIWMPEGTLWGTWDCIGVSWGCLGTTSGHLGLDVGWSGDHFGTYWNSGVRRNPHRKPMALKYRACAQKQASWNLPGGPAGPGETVHELQFRTYLPHAPGIRMT